MQVPITFSGWSYETQKETHHYDVRLLMGTRLIAWSFAEFFILHPQPLEFRGSIQFLDVIDVSSFHTLVVAIITVCLSNNTSGSSRVSSSNICQLSRNKAFSTIYNNHEFLLWGFLFGHRDILPIATENSLDYSTCKIKYPESNRTKPKRWYHPNRQGLEANRELQ